MTKWQKIQARIDDARDGVECAETDEARGDAVENLRWSADGFRAIASQLDQLADDIEGGHE